MEASVLGRGGQQAVKASCKKFGEDLELAQAVWDETMEQCSLDKQWVRALLQLKRFRRDKGPCWIPSRRFGVRQGGKIRPVDDISQYLINATVSCREKINLEGLGHICSTARFFMGAAGDNRALYLPEEFSQEGQCLADDWSLGEARDLYGRCLDLRQAYKQLVRRPEDAWAAILAVYCPADASVYFFEAVALPSDP